MLTLLVSSPVFHPDSGLACLCVQRGELGTREGVPREGVPREVASWLGLEVDGLDLVLG